MVDVAAQDYGVASERIATNAKIAKNAKIFCG
jgi:hypothetical protein